ncbi:Oidioi.mRNA.OKI2018_I69.chr2.g8237.t2.cds [Oikopleura dioica]|uniref:Oidioi.mRNA.OKI2018_I69.chr2.g8237.t2.cds n=1 Tax=Oikopleura dioica TaxID=34765 RepID=A0ABN7TEB1_OIKDI|nr:Oidioi.mRNA.OKI2018_I69.chr2.g8237.t2.cds [Oikopleura dioica]
MSTLDENLMYEMNGEEQGEDDGGGSIAGSDAQRNDRDNQDQEVAMELFDDIDDDMGDDGDEHDQEQDNEEALLLNEIEALNEVHKYDLDTMEAIDLEIEDDVILDVDDFNNQGYDNYEDMV